jgi:hypothetical protein
MAKKKNNIPSGFDDILGNIYSNAESMEEVTNIDDIPVEDTPLEDDDDKVPPVEKTEDGEKEDDTQKDSHEDDSEIPEDIINNKDNNTETKPEETELEDNIEPSEGDVIEAQQVGLLFDAVGQQLGWNMDDIDEKDRPLTVEALTEYWAETIKENSVPQYADDRIQKLDEYVRNGGKFEDFYQKQQESLTLDNIDMEDETNQKAVIRELLKHSNYTDEQINKKISRYEDADMLYEESEDALDRLKQIRTQEVEYARQQQEEYARQQAEQSKAFYDSVTKDINSLTNIRGIAIPREDRKALFDYIFKVDQNGLSQYQKDFNENLSKNLIESAYFTMKADALISSAEKKGESSAADKLRNILRHTSKNHTTYNADEKTKSVTDLLAGAF